MAKPAPKPSQESDPIALLRSALQVVTPSADDPGVGGSPPDPLEDGPITTGLLALGLKENVTLAHVGDGAERFIADVRYLLGPAPQIHVFEPRALQLRDLARRAMSDMRLVIHSCTLGEREDEIGSKKKRHAVRPLDAVGLAPNLLSINVPNREAAIISGARRVVRRWRPTLLVSGLFPDAEINRLALKGYLACTVQNGHMAPRQGGEDHVWFVPNTPRNQA